MLDLGLRRRFKWIFVIADVNQANHGADFLSYFHLLLDMHTPALQDRKAGLHVTAISTAETGPQAESMVSLSAPAAITTLLEEVPDVVQHPQYDQPIKHPVAAKARQLAPDRLSRHRSPI
eukprot:scpid50975/ scgid17332/ 